MVSGLWQMQTGGSAGEAQAAAGKAASKAARMLLRVKELEDRLDKLTLICMGMWSFLAESNKVTEEDLIKRVTQIDLEDGVADGKVTKQVARCDRCDRVMSPRHKRCIYCGTERLTLSAFDKLA